MTYGVGERCFLEVGQKLDAEICEVVVVAMHDLLVYGVYDNTSLSRVIHHEVARLALVVGSDLIEVAFKDDPELLRKDLVLPLVGRDVHHLDELGRRVLLDLEHEQADRVRHEVVLRTGEPLDLEQLLAAEVEHFNLALDQKLDIVPLLSLGSGLHLLVFLRCRLVFLILLSDTRELNVDLGVVGVEKVAQDLDVVLVGHVECLLHGGALERRILVDLVLRHDQMVKVLLDDHPIHRHVVAQVFLLVLLLLFFHHVHVVGGLDGGRDTVCDSFARQHRLPDDLLGQAADDLGGLFGD